MTPPYEPTAPDPKSYLRAGLRYPDSLTFLATRHEVAPESALSSAVVEVMSSASVDTATVTVTDSDRVPLTVLSLPSERYLAGPPTFSLFESEVLDVTRTPTGFLKVRLGAPYEVATLRESRAPIDRSTARAVTIDKTVVLAGLDRAKFGRNDAIFISSALQVDLSAFHSERVLPSGRTERASNYRPWQDSIPVSVDAAVLRVFKQIIQAVRLDPADTESVDRTDLLCAATAIAYGAPLYTTKPEAYAGLKNGLRLLEYRSIRNRSVLRERERAGTAVSSSIATPSRRAGSTEISPRPNAPLDELNAAFERGDAIDERMEALIQDAAPVEGFAEFVNNVFASFRENWDPSWRIAILERAEELSPALAGDDVWHEDIIAYASQLLTSTPGNMEISLARQTEAAMTALATWGRWPADASDDVLDSLPHEPEDESLLTWYCIYLGMAGLSRATIDEEVERVRAGDVLPSRERIEQLRSEG